MFWRIPEEVEEIPNVGNYKLTLGISNCVTNRNFHYWFNGTLQLKEFKM